MDNGNGIIFAFSYEFVYAYITNIAKPRIELLKKFEIYVST